MFPIYPKAILALADGSIFIGRSIGVAGATTGEVVFNTSITGYQEIMTDTSYYQQILTFTYPHIGNYGTNSEDIESSKVAAAGMIIKDLPLIDSNFRSTGDLTTYLANNNVVAIAEIDTRKLTRLLRDNGGQNGCILALEQGQEISDEIIKTAIEKAKAAPSMQGLDLAKEVSTTQTYTWNEKTWSLTAGHQIQTDFDYHVVALDYGIKYNILRLLADRKCKITVVPAKTNIQEILALNPDGVFLSNGPGDPAPCDYAIEAIQELLIRKIPVFGICLGHQLLALACGAKTSKMKFGHHGANHPVKDLATGQVYITSQNHGFMVEQETLPANLEATHISLFDKSLQGIAHIQAPAFSFQGHPEASPGPQDITYLFDKFIDMLKSYKENQHG